MHAAYWKYRAWRDLTLALGGEAHGFGVKGSDWFERPEGGAPTEEAWRGDLEFLRAWHGRLLEAVRVFPESRLDDQVRTSRRTYADVVMGAASHDVYHAGQIRLLLRLQEGFRRRLTRAVIRARRPHPPRREPLEPLGRREPAPGGQVSATADAGRPRT